MRLYARIFQDGVINRRSFLTELTPVKFDSLHIFDIFNGVNPG